MMNIKKIGSTLFVCVLMLGVALAVNYVSADWTAPTTSAPTCPAGASGCDLPVNVGTVNQVKNGGLSVNAFIANMGALFMQDVYLDKFKAGATVPTSAGDGRTLCADNTGKVVPCTTPSYSDMTDLVSFSAVWNGSAWVLGQSRIILTNDPTRPGQNRISLTGNRVSTGYYTLDAIYNGGFHVDSTEIISAVLNSSGCGNTSGTDAFKMSLVNYSGSNLIEFEVSDDDSRNDVCTGAQATFLFGYPTIRP